MSPVCRWEPTNAPGEQGRQPRGGGISVIPKCKLTNLWIRPQLVCKRAPTREPGRQECQHWYPKGHLDADITTRGQLHNPSTGRYQQSRFPERDECALTWASRVRAAPTELVTGSGSQGAGANGSEISDGDYEAGHPVNIHRCLPQRSPKRGPRHCD